MSGRVTADADAEVFLIESEYSDALLVRLRQIPNARWIKKLSRWRIPATVPAVEALARLVTTFGLGIDSKAANLIAIVERGAGQMRALSEAKDSSSYDPRFQNAVALGVPFARELFDFQPAAIIYGALAQRCFIGDKMGLGKSVEALGVLELELAYPALIVCKKTALGHWRRQIERWLPERSVMVGDFGPLSAEISLVTWGKLSAMPVGTASGSQPRFTSIVLDESHMAKSKHAKRTKNAKAIAKDCRVRLALTGTPIINRPSDLISQLDILGRLDTLGGFWFFAKRFCAAVETRFGWDFSGASNLEELQRYMRSTCFISREKTGPNGVLQSLPEKRREFIEIEPPPVLRVGYEEAERDVLGWLAANVSPEAAARAAPAEALVSLTILKHMAARMKVPAIIDWVKDFCEDNPEEKVVVFAHHLDVIREILAGVQITTDDRPALWAASLMGEMSSQEREHQLAFFKVGGAQVLIASLKTGGESIDLTEASTVVFVEFDWTPAAHEQAEDRCHRIGQKNAVIAYWFAAAGTIDDDICELLNVKAEMIGQVTGDIAAPLIARLNSRKEN